ncbi:hypothetical protein AAMO2058_001116900 [Amorphochlora amoebiformis]
MAYPYPLPRLDRATDDSKKRVRTIMPGSLPVTVTFHGATGSCVCCCQLLSLVTAPLRAVLLVILSILRIPFVLVWMALPIGCKTCMVRGLVKCGYPLYLTCVGKRYWDYVCSCIYVGGGTPRAHSVDIRPTRLTTCSIWPVPVAADNYAYIIIDHATGMCSVVDPGAHVPIALACFQLGVTPQSLILTHAHHDHSGGVRELLDDQQTLEVFCGEGEKPVGFKPKYLKDGQIIQIGTTQLQAIKTPCHTPGSLVFAVLKDPGEAPFFPREGRVEAQIHETAEALFTGDTLFLGGIGAPFEGSNNQMWKSLQKLRPYPNNVLVFPGHEYTESLRWFAAWLEPKNRLILSLAHEAQAQRTMRRPTIPGNLGIERRANPWLRADEADIRESIDARLDQYHTVSCCCRTWSCWHTPPKTWSTLLPDPPAPNGIPPAPPYSPGAHGDGPRHIGLPKLANSKATPLLTNQNVKKNGGLQLEPMERPDSKKAARNYSYFDRNLEDVKGLGKDIEGSKDVDPDAVFTNLRKLQSLYESLVPSRMFHLRGRRDGGQGQKLTDAMVWADGHVYLTGAISPVGGRLSASWRTASRDTSLSRGF